MSGEPLSMSSLRPPVPAASSGASSGAFSVPAAAPARRHRAPLRRRAVSLPHRTKGARLHDINEYRLRSLEEAVHGRPPRLPSGVNSRS